MGREIKAFRKWFVIAFALAFVAALGLGGCSSGSSNPAPEAKLTCKDFLAQKNTEQTASITGLLVGEGVEKPTASQIKVRREQVKLHCQSKAKPEDQIGAYKP